MCDDCGSTTRPLVTCWMNRACTRTKEVCLWGCRFCCENCGRPSYITTFDHGGPASDFVCFDHRCRKLSEIPYRYEDGTRQDAAWTSWLGQPLRFLHSTTMRKYVPAKHAAILFAALIFINEGFLKPPDEMLPEEYSDTNERFWRITSQLPHDCQVQICELCGLIWDVKPMNDADIRQACEQLEAAGFESFGQSR